MTDKICLICNRKYIPNGYNQKYCKECKKIAEKASIKKWVKKHEEDIKSKAKKYRDKNKSKAREYGIQWRKNNSEKLRLKKKKYYEENKDVILKKQSDYRHKNMDEINEKQRNYYKNNKDNYNPIKKNYNSFIQNSRRRKKSVSISFDEWLFFKKLPCHYCGEEPFEMKGTLDRIDNSKGYENGNIISCCNDCNKTRGERFTMEEFELIGEVIKKIKENRK